MILFANERFLILLFFLPLVPAVYGLLRYLRKRRILKLGDPALVKELMPSWSASKGWVRIILYTLAMMFFVIGGTLIAAAGLLLVVVLKKRAK